MISEQVKDFRVAHKHLCKFVRKPKKRGCRAYNGVLVAFKDDEGGTINFGWSLCNSPAGDKFDKAVGFAVAVDRSEPFAFHDSRYEGSLDCLASSVVRQLQVPDVLRKYALGLVKRAYVYYRLVPSQSLKG